MTPDHPITPPPKLVQQWFLGARAMPVDQWVTDVATQAARWGADQELEACCEWLINHGWFGSSNHDAIRGLHLARRPKPPSLKELALEMLECIPTHDNSGRENGIDLSVIRRALEQLDD